MSYDKMIERAEEEFELFERLLNRQLTDLEGGELDWLTDRLQMFLDACAGDPMLDKAAQDLRDRIRKRLGD